MPYAAVLAGSTVWVLGLLLPWILLYNFLKWVLLFPPWAAGAASDFLKSSHGIVQTMCVAPPDHFVPIKANSSSYLAREEMKHIKEDRWGEEVWGAEGKASPRLVLFFGKNVCIRGAHEEIESNILKRTVWSVPRYKITLLKLEALKTIGKYHGDHKYSVIRYPILFALTKNIAKQSQEWFVNGLTK